MSILRSLIALSCGVGLTLAAQSLFKIGEAEAGRAEMTRDGFSDALTTVLDRYVDPVDQGRVLASALKHVVSGLDEHSHYLTAAERKALGRRGFGSTGLMVRLHRPRPGERLPAWIEISAVLPGTPAAKLGLEAGDQILSVNGQDAALMLSQAEVEGLLAGPEGETIELAVQRRREPAPAALKITLGRPEVARLVEANMVERAGKKHAHVIIRAFRGGVGAEVQRVLAELRRAAGSEGLAGIILDVRGNPGGDVQEAVAVADLFISEGVLVRTRGRGGQILREELAHRAGTDETTRLVVVQDARSASASELLAIALQDHRRAQIVGERSYGKGTVQDVIGLPDGSVLSLTIARYFSPRDHSVDGNGVEPDIRVSIPSAVAARDLPEIAIEAALRGLAAAGTPSQSRG
jgi:carboxyl-terminal processing protease